MPEYVRHFTLLLILMLGEELKPTYRASEDHNYIPSQSIREGFCGIPHGKTTGLN